MRWVSSLVLVLIGLQLRMFAFAGDDQLVYRAIEKLKSSPKAVSLLEKAKAHWGLKDFHEIQDYVQLSNVSRTDAVLIRQFDPRSGEETRKREVTVFIKEKQSFNGFVLDLAHELVHAIDGPVWNPYDPSLAATEYIQTSIEGRGGEVKALYTECQIAIELKSAHGRCDRYIESKKVSYKKILQDFYRVGRHFDEIKTQLGAQMKQFPYLSEDEPELYSSTGGTPYPIALLREFSIVEKVACENTQKRLGAIRELASANPKNKAYEKETLQFLSRRCRSL